MAPAFGTLSAMPPALWITVGIVFVVVLCIAFPILALVYVSKTLRARGAAEIAERFPAADVLLSDTFVQSYGQTSRGVTQARGNGVLALTKDELFFMLYVPQRELRIPLSSITGITTPRHHLGKTGGAKLLHVAFTTPAGEDAIAWRLVDLEGWIARIESLRG